MGNLDIKVEVIPVLKDVILIWGILLVLFLLLRKLLYSPVTKFIAERKGKIDSDISNAKKLNAEAIQIKEEYEQKMAEIKEESQKILADSRARGEEVKAGIIAEAREEAQGIKLRARKEIEQERAAAFEGVKEETGNMALLIASKIMERDMTLENQDELIDKFIDEVGNSPWQN